MQNLESLFFLVKAAVKFRNLQISKILKLTQTNFFNTFQGYVHIFEVYKV